MPLGKEGKGEKEMKSLVVYILAMFHGALWASAWWAAAMFGWGEEYNILWAIPAIITVFSLLFLVMMIYFVFTNDV
jgi:uncharacterized membrane protein